MVLQFMYERKQIRLSRQSLINGYREITTFAHVNSTDARTEVPFVDSNTLLGVNSPKNIQI